jgi:FecR protein
MPARALILAALLCLCSLAAAETPRVAGKIELAEGIARITGKDQRERRPAVGDKVYEGDAIATAGKAELHLAMADGASFIVRENTQITIAAYVADGGDQDRSLIELAKGALRAVSGWIGRYNRSNYAIRTPVATLGVRGTDHEATHLLEGDPRGKPGTYDKVNAGLVVLKSDRGSVEIPANKAAYLSLEGLPPQLLAAIPDFFKPGKYEQEFNRRARELERALDSLRKGRVDELLKLKDQKFNLPKAPTGEELRKGFGNLFKR